MKNDIILKEKKCFDELNVSTEKEDGFQDISLLENIKPQLRKIPVEIRDVFIDELYQHTPHADLEGTEPSGDAKKVTPPKILLFGWRRTVKLLLLIMEELQEKVNVFADPTMMYIFVRILTSKDLSQEEEKMYLGCPTNLFAYIVERLEPYCTSFNPTNIERPGLFFSKAGHPITKGCLYSSGIKKLHLKKIIDDIFKKYC